MEKNSIFNLLIILAILFVVSVGCSDDDRNIYKNEKSVEENFYISIELPASQKEFTEGYPKNIEAKAYFRGTEVSDHAEFIWHSDPDGNISNGQAISTEYLSNGDHIITVNAYYKSEVAFEIVSIKKVTVPEIEQNTQSIDNRIIDRVDGTVYVDNQDGTVTDTTTNLMWEQTDDGYPRNIYDSYEHCEELDFAGYKDWRVPTLSELKEISNIGPHKQEPIICRIFDNKQASYWTQTKSNLKLRSKPGSAFYSTVDYNWNDSRNGFVGESIDPAYEYTKRYVRCVR